MCNFLTSILVDYKTLNQPFVFNASLNATLNRDENSSFRRDLRGDAKTLGSRGSILPPGSSPRGRIYEKKAKSKKQIIYPLRDLQRSFLVVMVDWCNLASSGAH